MVKEIVLAIDPALRKVEEILLWTNKFKTGAVFTGCHVVFWLFTNFYIRTYCTISCIFLLLHLLDAYRTKKRRELIKLHSTNQNLIENISSLGRYIIIIYNKINTVWKAMSKIKQKNRFHYFLIVLTIWGVAAIVGIKISGFYLAYLLFWVVFFVPALLHYNVPRKMLSRMAPLLRQLDQSMKYERRSIIDKRDLLVDVKLLQTDAIDDAQEDEYMKAFALTDLKENQQRYFDHLQDDEDEDDDAVSNSMISEGDDSEANDEFHFNEDDDEHLNKHKKFDTVVRKSHKKILDITDIDLEDDSLLPDDTLPSFSHFDDSLPLHKKKTSKNNRSQITTDDDDEFHLQNESLLKNIDVGQNRVKRVKNRASILERDFYSNDLTDTSKKTTTSNNNAAAAPYTSMFASSTIQEPVNALMNKMLFSAASSLIGNSLNPQPQQQRRNVPKSTSQNRLNENDIDETFDFLDEELNKYDNE